MPKTQDALQKAREKKTLEKRRSVEQAISALQEKKEPITFASVASVANVSRPFLYKNFKNLLESLRENSREKSEMIDGMKIPSRTLDGHKHIEAALKNKLERLKEELTKSRKEAATLKQQLERARGECEHWRRLSIQSRQENSDTTFFNKI